MESIESAVDRAYQHEVRDLVRRIEDLAAMQSAAPAHVSHTRQGALAQALSRWLPPLVQEMAAGLDLKTRAPLVEVVPEGLLIRLEPK
jgi:hypothetical protein